MNCPNCGNAKQAQGRCCAKEISYLRTKIANQSKVIERLEDQRDRALRQAEQPAIINNDYFNNPLGYD